MILTDARPEQLEQVLDHTHAIWSDGLDRASYHDYVGTLLASDWAREGARNYRFVVLRDDAHGVVAASKLYRLAARLDEDRIHLGGIGAVFTLPAHRKCGYAAEMIRLLHGLMRERGDALSLLFSEIGMEYYKRLGYRAIKPPAVTLDVQDVPEKPEGLRRMHRSELDLVARLRDQDDATASFVLQRDHAYWKYLLARASYPTLSLGRERWESRLMLAGREGYLWSLFHTSAGNTRARLLEYAETQPGGALPRLLDDLFLECRRRGIGSVEAWVSPSRAPGDARLAGGRPAAHQAAIPMWYPLDDEASADLGRHQKPMTIHLADVF